MLSKMSLALALLLGAVVSSHSEGLTNISVHVEGPGLIHGIIKRIDFKVDPAPQSSLPANTGIAKYDWGGLGAHTYPFGIYAPEGSHSTMIVPTGHEDGHDRSVNRREVHVFVPGASRLEPGKTYSGMVQVLRVEAHEHGLDSSQYARVSVVDMAPAQIVVRGEKGALGALKRLSAKLRPW